MRGITNKLPGITLRKKLLPFSKIYNSILAFFQHIFSVFMLGVSGITGLFRREESKIVQEKKDPDPEHFTIFDKSSCDMVDSCKSQDALGIAKDIGIGVLPVDQLGMKELCIDKYSGVSTYATRDGDGLIFSIEKGKEKSKMILSKKIATSKKIKRIVKSGGFKSVYTPDLKHVSLLLKNLFTTVAIRDSGLADMIFDLGCEEYIEQPGKFESAIRSLAAISSKHYFPDFIINNNQEQTSRGYIAALWHGYNTAPTATVDLDLSVGVGAIKFIEDEEYSVILDENTTCETMDTNWQTSVVEEINDEISNPTIDTDKPIPDGVYRFIDLCILFPESTDALYKSFIPKQDTQTEWFFSYVAEMSRRNFNKKARRII
ncbi:MAG: hypothetical protein KAH32_05330 [Chlamydiia bacterium]|nr:hypothetical protein [Chlamydiia bacterium]